MTFLHVHVVTGQAELQTVLRFLKNGRTPLGLDLGADNNVQHILVHPTTPVADPIYTIVYTTDREP